MLVPLTRETQEQLLPLIATYPQYRHCWGKIRDFLRRLLVSVAAVVAVWVIDLIAGDGYHSLLFIVGFFVGLFWFWAPIVKASQRNAKTRRYPYCGFWEGQVLDAYVTEELIGQEETVNSRGELTIVENRERCINVEVGDDTGFTTVLQTRLDREHKAIAPGQRAQMVVLSSRPDLATIAQTTDLYLPDRKLWVSDYPYLQREFFESVGDHLSPRRPAAPPRRPRRPAPPERSPYESPRPVRRLRSFDPD